MSKGVVRSAQACPGGRGAAARTAAVPRAHAGLRHRPRMTTTPSAPLPLPRLARLTVLGRNGMATALTDLLTSTGRPVRRAAPPVPVDLRLADLTGVVFICLPWAELAAYRAAL